MTSKQYRRAQTHPSEAMSQMNDFYDAWISGSGAQFVEQLYDFNCYHEATIQQLDRDWELQLTRYSVKHISDNPTVERLMFEFGDIDKFTRDTLTQVLRNSAEIHILNADMETNSETPMVDTDTYADAIEEIESSTRHAVGCDHTGDWGVIV